MISLETPETIAAGKPVTVTIRHTLPEELGEQQVPVPFKAGKPAKRVDGKVVKIKGDGTIAGKNDRAEPGLFP